MTYVGIDVSKATFVVAYSSTKTSRTRTFKNTVKGVHEFIQTISPRLIALYGEKMQPAPYKLRSDAILVLKQKRTVLR